MSVEIVGPASRSAAARNYGTDPGASGPSHTAPAEITCGCIDDHDLIRLVDLQAIGVPLFDAALMVWAPDRARALTWREGFRLGFREAFPWLTFPTPPTQGEAA